MKLKIFTALLPFFFLTSFNLKTNHQPMRAAMANGPGLMLKANLLEHKFLDLYGNLEGESKPSFEIFRKALVGFMNLKSQGKLSTKNLLTIIDFGLASDKKRLWVIDLNRNSVIFNNLVAHGRNTGNIMATEFSNVPNSNMSSLGFYVTANTYIGKHGLSLRLKGMEEEFNSAAMKRAIVMHGADYVSQEFIDRYGRLGRSFGCPSVPTEVSQEIIETIANKTCLFIYAPGFDYDKKSMLLNKSGAVEFFAANDFMI